jgi:hypothetical protein
MKRLFIIALAAIALLVGCGSSNKLDKKSAFDVLKKGVPFPHVLDYDIFCGDPDVARRLLNTAVEKEGYITIQRTQKMGDIGKPLILFTNKATPYLLPTPEGDRKYNIQKVKLADVELKEVTAVTNNEADKSAVVEYTTTYKNVTPFAALVLKDVAALKSHRVYLSLHGNDWKVEKKKGLW